MTLIQPRDASEREQQDLQSRLDTSEAIVVSLKQQVSQLASDIASHSRQLQEFRADLNEANNRADTAEESQRNLQMESSALLSEWEEVRPKLVELSDKNAED